MAQPPKERQGWYRGRGGQPRHDVHNTLWQETWACDNNISCSICMMNLWWLWWYVSLLPACFCLQKTQPTPLRGLNCICWIHSNLKRSVCYVTSVQTQWFIALQGYYDEEGWYYPPPGAEEFGEVPDMPPAVAEGAGVAVWSNGGKVSSRYHEIHQPSPARLTAWNIVEHVA